MTSAFIFVSEIELAIHKRKSSVQSEKKFIKYIVTNLDQEFFCFSICNSACDSPTSAQTTKLKLHFKPFTNTK